MEQTANQPVEGRHRLNEEREEDEISADPLSNIEEEEMEDEEDVKEGEETMDENESVSSNDKLLVKADSDEAQNTLPSIREQTHSESEDKPVGTTQDEREETAEPTTHAPPSDEDLLSSEEFVLLNLDTQQESNEQSQLGEEKMSSGVDTTSQQNLEHPSPQAEELPENSISQLNDSGGSAASVSKETLGEEEEEETKHSSETEEEDKTAVVDKSNDVVVVVDGDSATQFLLVPLEKVCCMYT